MSASPASPISLEANRANAQLSTGPRTEEGKQRSSLNATTHGLFATAAVLPHEDPAVYQSFCQKFLKDLQPKGMLEEQLAQTMVDTQWRLNRCRSIEQTILSTPADTVKEQIDALNKFSMYEQRLTRMLQNTLKQYLVMQTNRYHWYEREFKEASTIAKHLGTKEKPYDPSEDGFVLTTAELAARMRRDQRLTGAGRAHGHIVPADSGRKAA